MENNFDSIYSDVVIIGAGPAGLCLGYHLKKLGVNYLILEQGSCVGSSWRKMPDHLHLITLWKSNFLVQEDRTLFHPYRKLSAVEFADYLDSFFKKNELNVKLDCIVEQITQDRGKHLVRTSGRNYMARVVVDCRGYFNFPFLPDYRISGEAPLMLHFKDYKNCQQLSGYKNILIVGKRLSAGQLIAELSISGKHNLFLSVRSSIRFGARTFLLNHYLRHLDTYEDIARTFSSKIKRHIEIPMDYAVKAMIKSGVAVYSDIDRIEGKNVFFKDGKTTIVDAIIFATGFRPPDVNLADDFESQTVKNLFYLGRNSQRTFASRFIRGIREDAGILGRLILGSLESSKRSQ